MKVAIVMLAAFLALAPATAGATCLAGGSPTYGDVEWIQISDCWATGIELPCYYASLDVSRHQGIVTGTYVGAHGSSRLGQYELLPEVGDQARYARILTLLHEAQVFEHDPLFKRQGPGKIYALTDGRQFALSLDRCTATFSVRVPNMEFYPPLRAEKRWGILAPALRTIVESFSWKQVRRPDEHRDMGAIMSMGRTLRP